MNLASVSPLRPCPRALPPGSVLLVLILLLPLAAAVPRSLAGQDLSEVEIETIAVAEDVYMLMGAGGNIGVSVGVDGAFVIDDQYAPLTDRILTAIRRLTDGPIPFVINTHWHGDHVGGNENMGRAGAVIVAHDNVRERMAVEQVLARFGDTTRVPPSPPDALPVVTFDSEVAFHLNGQELRVIHVPRAHTDGDAIIHFTGANVVHMGDTFWTSGYPFIDVSSGGGIDGVLEAAERALAITDDDTRIIPGHGPLSDRAGLESYHAMLRTIRDRVAEAKAAGRTLEEAQGMRLTAEWDETWGGGFIGPDALVASIWESLE